MEIKDYESGRNLYDVDLILTREEAEELSGYLTRLLENPSLRSVQLSNIEGLRLSAEVSVTLASSPLKSIHSPLAHP